MLMAAHTSIAAVAGMLAGAAVFLAFVGAIVSWAVRGVVRDESAKQTASLDTRIDEKLAPIKAELSYNSGTSLKDQARDAASGVRALTTRFEDYKTANDQRLGRVEHEIQRLWLPGPAPVAPMPAPVA